MKNAYPIVLTKERNGFTVYVPDFDINTEGTDLPSAIEMARDAIGLMGIDMEDDGKTIPIARNMHDVAISETDSIVTLVDVDFTEYRRKNERRVVKKNCTIPSWLCSEAERAGINFSKVLQDALIEKLKIGE